MAEIKDGVNAFPLTKELETLQDYFEVLPDELKKLKCWGVITVVLEEGGPRVISSLTDPEAINQLMSLILSSDKLETPSDSIPKNKLN